MTRIIWRFLISLIIVFGVLGEGIMAAHQVRAATSIGEVVVIDDRPKPARIIMHQEQKYQNQRKSLRYRHANRLIVCHRPAKEDKPGIR
ncbi:hypothetical protein Lpp123_12586 [Lacticaseibacillus paracasei subsp. paracasei Lpp123]|uniref:Uncharacterized protein n=1 Tax=Lacticaseibacillus paracasei subsp. paracasei Lpp123 TaxID=1256201 RepID=A0A829GE02_LACPA|nr:hypothetical protein Lpp123_12586 [Lacticaseibacillus paracasei subsp. paracasei Lpp123]